MAETPASLDDMSRRDLSELAKTLGIADAEVMTRAELRAAIERNQAVPRTAQSPWPTTWLGVARGLIASIVEQGLNLPDAAALIRGDTKLTSPPKPPPPVATVTLARIYAAQGHLQRAIDTLSEVLKSDPDHEPARELRDELAARKGPGRAASVSVPAPSAPIESAPVVAPTARTEAEPAPDGSASEPAATYSEPALTHPDAAAAEAAPQVDTDAPDGAASPAPASQPPLTQPPPTVDDQPTVTAEAPSIADEPLPAAAPEAPDSAQPGRATPRREPPRPPAAELVLIETDAPARYLYWELSANVPAPVPPEQCSLLLVAHTPAPSGAERSERRLSVTAASGAVRLVGVPERAVLRALLTREGAPHAQNGAAASKPLAVAGAVRAQEPPSDPALKVTFSPSRLQNPADLAVRAIDRLAEASAVHW